MSFELLPIIDRMLDFYQKPRDAAIFQLYLNMLLPRDSYGKGDTKGDLVLPIGGYNPMGKEHVSEQLTALKALDTEGVMQNVISQVNKKDDKTQPHFKIALCLSDDLKGGWTNRFTTDYDSKFKLKIHIKLAEIPF